MKTINLHTDMGTENTGNYYYKDGLLFDKEQNDYFSGELVSYYMSGKIQNVTPYNEGYRNGVQKTYYEDGKIEMEAEIKMNINNGYMKTWDDKGKLTSTRFYENGKIKELEIFDMKED